MIREPKRTETYAKGSTKDQRKSLIAILQRIQVSVYIRKAVSLLAKLLVGYQVKCNSEFGHGLFFERKK